ncbi:zinc finger, CCHC-type containing protein [Tanacetum coccineum]
MAAAAMKHMALSFAKLEKFEGVVFRRWQKKMHFMLSSMSVVYVLTTPMPNDGGENPTMEQAQKRGPNGTMILCLQKAKYMAEDASSKKFLVSNFTNYKMTDLRPGLEQYNELLGILGRFTQHNMNMDESIKVSCIIDKLPPSWKDFKHTLKHLKEELTLIELGSHLRIEESLRAQDNDKPKGNNVVVPSVFNMVEHNNSSRYNDNKGKPNGSSTKDDDVAWWVDSGANVHLFKFRCWFKTYESLNDRSILHMGNESTALVHGRGCVDLRLNIVFDNIDSAFMSTSKLNDSILWHARLGHVHFKRMQDISNEALDKLKVFKTKVELQQGSLIKRFKTDGGGMNRVVERNGYFKVSYSGPESRVLGEAMAVVRLPDPKLKTLGERGIECILIWIARSSPRAFSFYVIEPNDFVAINSIIESRDAIFDEHKFSFVPRPSQRSLVKGTEDSGGLVVPEKTSDEIVQEMRALGCKWIFKRKMNVDGTVEKFKASLIIHQMDVKTTFLNGELEEEAPKKWHRKFDASGKGVIICLYVDDMLIFRTDQVQVDLTKEFLSLRPDIAFVAGKLSRYTSNPGTQHWQVIQKASKKQTCITGSTIESEFVALAAAGKEAEWLKNLLLEIPLWVKPMVPISILCDSAATLAKAYSQMYNGKSRHLGVRHSMIRELITNGVISIEFVRSHQNQADHLTKGLARDLDLKSAEGMGLKSN